MYMSHKEQQVIDTDRIYFPGQRRVYKSLTQISEYTVAPTNKKALPQSNEGVYERKHWFKNTELKKLPFNRDY